MVQDTLNQLVLCFENELNDFKMNKELNGMNIKAK